MADGDDERHVRTIPGSIVAWVIILLWTLMIGSCYFGVSHMSFGPLGRLQ